MKKIRLLLVASALVTAAGTAMADEQVVRDSSDLSRQFIPTDVRAEVGTTGYGGAVTWNVNPHVGITAGYNGGDISWRNSIKSHGTKFDLEQDNKTAYLNAEIRPWANWFYIAAGTAYLDNDYDLSSKSDNGRLVINDHKFTGYTGEVNGKLKYENKIAPYLGLGAHPQLSEHWGLFGEVGAYYVGNPTATLSSTNYAAQAEDGTSMLEAVKEQERSINNDAKYKWLPVAKVGVSYKF